MLGGKKEPHVNGCQYESNDTPPRSLYVRGNFTLPPSDSDVMKSKFPLTYRDLGLVSLDLS